MLCYVLIVKALSGRERREFFVDVVRAVQRQEYLWRVWRVSSSIEIHETAPAHVWGRDA